MYCTATKTAFLQAKYLQFTRVIHGEYTAKTEHITFLPLGRVREIVGVSSRCCASTVLRRAMAAQLHWRLKGCNKRPAPGDPVSLPPLQLRAAASAQQLVQSIPGVPASGSWAPPRVHSTVLGAGCALALRTRHSAPSGKAPKALSGKAPATAGDATAALYCSFIGRATRASD